MLTLAQIFRGRSLGHASREQERPHREDAGERYYSYVCVCFTGGGDCCEIRRDKHSLEQLMEMTACDMTAFL